MNDRVARLTGALSKAALGIEIGPYFNPLVPKRQGYNSLSIDVFDGQTLRRLAESDPNIPNEVIANIEDVDIIGSAAEIEDVIRARQQLGTFDYIISSHNFEHIPDPIRFLQGCEAVLKEGGQLIMAIPEKRACFDYFRPVSSLDEMLLAFREKRRRPSIEQLFRQHIYWEQIHRDGAPLAGWSIDDNPREIVPHFSLENAFGIWKSQTENPDEIYRDTHCWAFTPSSFELIIRDLVYLGLVRFEVESISCAYGNEFYARFKKTAGSALSAEECTEYPARRTALLLRVMDELSLNSPIVFSHRMKAEQRLNGQETPAELREANHSTSLRTWVRRILRRLS